MTVIWDFTATDISCSSQIQCQAVQPGVLLDLVFSESGSATWWPAQMGAPVVTDPYFSLSLSQRFEIGAPDYAASTVFKTLGTGYSITWGETDGNLDSVSIIIQTTQDNIRIGMTGGEIASDGGLWGCGGTQCRISGSWQDPLPASVPEPTLTGLALCTAVIISAAWQRCPGAMSGLMGRAPAAR